MNLRVIALACGVVALLWGAHGVAADSVGMVPIENVRLGMSVAELKAARPGAEVWKLGSFSLFPDDDREDDKPTDKKVAGGQSDEEKTGREILVEKLANHDLFSGVFYTFEDGHLVVVNIRSGDYKPEHSQRKRRAFYELLFAKYGAEPEQRVILDAMAGFRYYAPFLLWKRGKVMMYASATPDFRQIVSRKGGYFLVVATTEAVKLAEGFQFCDVDAEQMRDVFRRAGLPLETPTPSEASRTQE